MLTRLRRRYRDLGLTGCLTIDENARHPFTLSAIARGHSPVKWREFTRAGRDPDVVIQTVLDEIDRRESEKARPEVVQVVERCIDTSSKNGRAA